MTDQERRAIVASKVGLAIERHRLTELRPRWLSSAEPLRHGMGFSMQCPWHLHDQADRLEFWFVKPRDGGEGLTRGQGLRDLTHRPAFLFGFTGRDFDNLTLWTAQPKEDECVSASGKHWWGYIAGGMVYSCSRWSAL